MGCGYWGRNLLRVLAQSNDVDVRWVIDGAPGAVDHVTSRYPDLETSPDEMVLFGDDTVDAVVIATPAADHYRAAKLSLESGKHTFAEKPLAMSTTEAESLVNLANDNGLALMAGHTFLYNSAVREVKNLIDSGDLGDIYYVYSRRVNLGTVRQDVNVLWNLAPHDISIINYWLDDEATSASATGGTFLQPGIEDVVFATLSFGSGTVANIHLSWLDPHKIRTMTVVGSKKMVVFDDVSADARLTIHDMGVDITQGQMTANPFETFGQFQVAHRQGDTVIPRIPYPEPLAEEMKHFIECIRDGSQPRTGGQHAISVVRSLEMIQACLDQNKAAPIS
ncbi:MAG: Gfo/Idh/MocA family oxidoreductase [SAR202 cluster bacterium]|nr:Gfo/Idh/MocA family oxidoreductase [SAR202 cluster bacterium]